MHHVLNTTLNSPGHFQIPIHYKGNHFLVHEHKQDLHHITCICHFLKDVVKNVLVSAILQHISLLRLLPKLYFKKVLLNTICYMLLAPLRFIT